MSEAAAADEVRVVVPRTLATGTANEVVVHADQTVVQRAAKFAFAGDVFDIRVLHEGLTRSALATTRPGVFPAEVPPARARGAR